MKTCILFVSHIVNNEVEQRYRSLKTAADAVGHDIFFCGDLDMLQPSAIPKDIDFYGFSYQKFKDLVPHMVYDNQRNVYQNCLPMVVFPFAHDHKDAYSYFWIIEFDVCCYGDWADFFMKYINENADLVTSKPTFKSYAEFPNWWAYKNVDKNVLDMLVKEGCVHEGLMCCSRLSAKALSQIDAFYKLYNGNKFMFFEMAWPTCVFKNKGRVVVFDSNYFIFRPEMPKRFKDFRDNTLYHPVKPHIEWQRVMQSRKRP